MRAVVRAAAVARSCRCGCHAASRGSSTFASEGSRVGKCAVRSWTCASSREVSTSSWKAQDSSTTATPDLSYRQQFKQDKRRLKEASKSSSAREARQRLIDDWELTVGIEIHAELDTERKLFSSALTTSSHSPEVMEGDDSPAAAPKPNTNVALHDLGYPGAQPVFQVGTIVPAVRAALALGCTVHRKSAFDRKHYFYADQPAGYQITQFYRPFATDGAVVLDAAEAGDDKVTVRIERVQLEQDTAKSLVGGAAGTSTLLDFNRTGHPLIEIVSRPDLHSPRYAAAYVRKVQEMLRAVGAVTAGMESGGLRADVNVSVRRRGSTDHQAPLGQRTEIKNLSSLRAIEDAVTAERDRQIKVLEAGGKIESETRGWTLGGSETVLLRSKEGEVDYRYMPDPDIPSLIIADDLMARLRETAPLLPEAIIADVQSRFDISSTAARTLYQIDDGARLEYLAETAARLERSATSNDKAYLAILRKTASNYVLHDIPALLTKHQRSWSPALVPVDRLTELVALLGSGQLHKHGAKTLLAHIFLDVESARGTPVALAAARAGLLLLLNSSVDGASGAAAATASTAGSSGAGAGEHDELIRRIARSVFAANGRMVSDVLVKKETKKINFFAGQVMRELGKLGKAQAVDPRHVSVVVHDAFWSENGTQ